MRVNPVDLTGADAASALASSITAAARDTDVVLLVRSEGRALGLAFYDDLQGARAVAEARVPVVCGLGGGVERTASDEVASSTVATADAAVGWVLHRLVRAQRLLEELAAEVAGAVRTADAGFRQSLEQAKEDADEAARQAALRTERSRARHRQVLWTACALLTLLTVGLAVVTGTPWVMTALSLPAGLLVGVPLAWRYQANRGVARMSQRNEDFTAVLDRLRTVRDELVGTFNPERVAVLRGLAQELVTEGRELLGRATGVSGPDQPAAVRRQDAALPAVEHTGAAAVLDAELVSIDLEAGSERAGQQ